MVLEKMQKPILYIHKLSLEKQSAPMQQFFISKSKNEKHSKVQDSVNESDYAVGNSKEIESTTEIQLPKEIVSNPEFVDRLDDDTDEPRIMEFIIEGILSSGEKEASTEEPKPIQNASHSQEITSKIKKEKRLSFNDLSLVNKLVQLRKMPSNVVKFMFEFVTDEYTYKGYFLSHKDGVFSILNQNTNQTIKIKEKNFIDINLIGI